MHESRFITPEVERFDFGESIVYAKRTTHVPDNDDDDEIWPTRGWKHFVTNSTTLFGDKKIQHDVLKKYFVGCCAVLSLNKKDFFQATDSEVAKDLSERGINHTEQTWRKVVNEQLRRLEALDNESGQPVAQQQEQRQQQQEQGGARSGGGSGAAGAGAGTCYAKYTNTLSRVTKRSKELDPRSMPSVSSGRGGGGARSGGAGRSRSGGGGGRGRRELEAQMTRRGAQTEPHKRSKRGEFLLSTFGGDWCSLEIIRDAPAEPLELDGVLVNGETKANVTFVRVTNKSLENNNFIPGLVLSVAADVTPEKREACEKMIRLWREGKALVKFGKSSKLLRAPDSEIWDALGANGVLGKIHDCLDMSTEKTRDNVYATVMAYLTAVKFALIDAEEAEAAASGAAGGRGAGSGGAGSYSSGGGGGGGRGCGDGHMILARLMEPNMPLNLGEFPREDLDVENEDIPITQLIPMCSKKLKELRDDPLYYKFPSCYDTTGEDLKNYNLRKMYAVRRDGKIVMAHPSRTKSQLRKTLLTKSVPVKTWMRLLDDAIKIMEDEAVAGRGSLASHGTKKRGRAVEGGRAQKKNKK